MNLTSTVIMRPARSVGGALRLPGDKSVSHRYAMLAAIAEGDTRLENFSTGADCASTLGCVRALGVEVQRSETASSFTAAARNYRRRSRFSIAATPAPPCGC
jgi:3-phosphoshikimate 1-carboxyvinyltransferase